MKSVFLTSCALTIGLLIAWPSGAFAQASDAPSSLKVRANYSGAGTVDATHKVWVVLWDTPDFIKGSAMPVATQSSSSKNAVVTFADVKKTPAYISTVYDSSGQWEAQSAPPEGSSLGIYSKDPGTPEPINLEPGKTTKIEFTFDDTVKMKGGQPNR